MVQIDKKTDKLVLLKANTKREEILLLIMEKSIMMNDNSKTRTCSNRYVHQQLTKFSRISYF